MSGIISYTTLGGKSGIIGPIPSFSAGLTTDHSSPGEVVFTHVDYNSGGHYNNSNGRFTAPITGKYLFSLFCMSGNSNHTLDIELKLNGAGNDRLVPYSGATGGVYNHTAASKIIELTSGQYVSFFCNAVIYGTTNGRHGGFSGHLIG